MKIIEIDSIQELTIIIGEKMPECRIGSYLTSDSVGRWRCTVKEQGKASDRAVLRCNIWNKHRFCLSQLVSILVEGSPV